MAKAKKKRADKYDEKLSINGTFEDVIGISVKPLPAIDSRMIYTGAEMEVIEKSLNEVKKDEQNWLIYYLSPATGDKWVKEYPNSEHHGGGAPQLRKIKTFPWE